MTLLLPNPLATKTTTQAAISPMTTGVGFVEPTIPVRFDAAKGRMTFVFLAPSAMQAAHCQPTGAWRMQSVQMGRSQWAQAADASRSG